MAVGRKISVLLPLPAIPLFVNDTLMAQFGLLRWV
jgi:hypothetical protein